MITLLLLLACHRDKEPESWSAEDRVAGARAPLTALCDDNDETDCALPWPSSRFMTADTGRSTGLRVALDAGALPVDDDPVLLNAADGFSPISGIMAGFPQHLDAATVDGNLLLIVAEPSSPLYGTSVPLLTELVPGGSTLAPRDLVIGRPLRPMPPNAEMVAVVLDGLKDLDGDTPEVSRPTALALGDAEPESQAEADWQAYNAPTRALLQAAGVDPARVLKVWDFVTRSADDATVRQDAIHQADLEAFEAGEVSVRIDEVRMAPGRDIAMIVRGALLGLPSFVGDDGLMALDDAGLPLPTGQEREAPFRVVVPAGEGDYTIALYGHGTGGNVEDDAFDAESGAAGIAKVGMQWDGWTDASLFATFGRICNEVLEGSAASTAGLVSSVANVRAVLVALDGVLGEALSAETIGGEANPAVGRTPITDEPLWMGGSLGGTMGAVVLLSEERVRYAVLNVAGGGWTHFVPASSTYDMLEGVLVSNYGDTFAASQAVVMSQTAWDDADGAAWGSRRGDDMALVQLSVGDPILPNIGSEILAATLDARLLEPYIYDVSTLEHAATVSDASALEQFEVPASESDLGIHGFAARDTPAGDAAMKQIFEFFQSALAGKPVIAHASECEADNADGSCDYSAAW